MFKPISGWMKYKVNNKEFSNVEKNVTQAVIIAESSDDGKLTEVNAYISNGIFVIYVDKVGGSRSTKYYRLNSKSEIVKMSDAQVDKLQRLERNK